MSNEKNKQDFFQEVFDVNCRETQKPRVLGGSRISKEQMKALGIKSLPKQSTKDCQ
jgi:hypothetical protein